MPDRKGQTLLKTILASYDRLELLKRRAAAGVLAPDQVEVVRREAKGLIDEIEAAFPSQTEAGSLAEIVQRYSLDRYQIAILLALLSKSLRADSPFLTGREILATLFDGTFDILQGASYLHDTAVLVSAGLVVPDMSAEGDEDALETRFRLSRRVYRLILDEFTPAPAKEPRSRSKRDDKGYRNNSGHLLDLKRLSLLYRKRASKVFGLDYWEELGVCAAESVTRLNRQIREQRRRIEERVAKTARPEKLHAMKLFARHNLREEEVVILVTLLFQEFLEGDPYLPSSDLLKLVAQSDEDLLGKRGIFSKRGALIKQQLIVLEDTVNGKELTGEVFLPGWAVESLLSGRRGDERGIDTDARLDFHNYLKDLDSSEDFFDQLDG